VTLRIGAFGQYWYPEQGGGLDRYFFEMVKYLALQGDDLDFFTVGMPPTTFHGAKGYSFADPAMSLPRRLASAYACFGQHLQQPYDVLNFHFALYAAPTIPHLKKDVPIVSHFHGPWALECLAEGDSPMKMRVKMLLERYVLKHSQRFVTLSHAFADLLAQVYRFDRNTIDVVPMGVDTTFFKPVDKRTAREHLGWPTDRFILFTARRLVKRVGLYELIDALARIPKKNDIWLSIAGRGPEGPKLQSLISERQLANNVKMLGYISEEELALSYAAADLVILPSQDLEGFGAVIAESLACGTPVMVTPIGGMPEYLQRLDTRLIASGSDADSLAQSLISLIENAQSLPDVMTCRAYAEATFSWPRVAETLKHLFIQVRS